MAQKTILVGARVPLPIRDAIEKQAQAEDRTMSQIIRRALVHAVEPKGGKG